MPGRSPNAYLLGTISLVAGALLSATGGLFIHQLDSTYSLFGQLGAIGVAGLVLTYLYRAFTKRGQAKPGEVRRVRAFVVCSALSLALFTYSVVEGTIALATGLMFGTALCTEFVGDRLYLKKRATTSWFAFVVVLVSVTAMEGPLTTTFAAVGSGVFLAFANFERRKVSGISQVVSMRLSFIVLAVVCIPLGFLSGGIFSRTAILQSCVLPFAYALMRLGSTALMVQGFKRMAPALGVPLLSLEILFATIFGAVMLDESMHGLQWVAIIAITLACMSPLASHLRKRSKGLTPYAISGGS